MASRPPDRRATHGGGLGSSHDGERGPMWNYARIANDILLQLRVGYWMIGDRLPSIKELQKQYGGVGVQTVRNAYALLIRRGCVEAVHGSGYYVVSIPPDNTDPAASLDRLQDAILRAQAELDALREAMGSAPRDHGNDL